MVGIFCVRSAASHLARRIGLSLNLRSFGAAAAVELPDDYDYYNDGDYELSRDQLRLVPTNDSDGSIEGRGVQWVFIGNPGAKKHVYAEKLSKLLQVPHISMRTLVRQELNPRSSLYKQIANAVNEGKLVPEDIIFGLLSKRLEEGYYRGETGFILDGIPRSRIQAEILDQIADIDLVVNFRCTEDCLVKTVRNSGTTLVKTSFAGTEDAQKEKFRNYEEQNKPLEDYYRKKMKLLDFQAAGGPGETWQGLLSLLHLKHINAIHSSQKLTV
ncbi:probable adenylate kinase 7, mitochondrial isoform X2 [Telopea speciosissima]|uniref:probable adenylate kinase 7, mitochondrial isoform X2 n=1 Tax=Telopea speciosissima TaxID=54955 RepID=UPI001CC4F8CA|nr:probable adenylate kinase 7, mitochondrial isoform X2 [Telopea speciosissima]